jgi:beta-glucosidase-like glycosyl hydrolase
MQDSPLGVRFGTYSSAFPAGMNAAMTWDRELMYLRGLAMGEEFKGKGVNMALGPVVSTVISGMKRHALIT